MKTGIKTRNRLLKNSYRSLNKVPDLDKLEFPK